MKRFLISVCCVLTGCVAEVELPHIQGDVHDAAVEVVLDISGSGQVKSALSLDENALREMAVAVYRNGILENLEYFPSFQSRVRLELIEGGTYDIYVAANMGVLPSCLREDEFCNAFQFSISSIADLKDCIPMAWSGCGIDVCQGMKPIEVQLERLAAKVAFTLDKSMLGGFMVTSVRLNQCASVVRPFKGARGAGSRVEDPSEIIPGDSATQTDLAELNEGGRVTFYTLENCQGVLLPENKSSAAKIPESLGEKAGLCTYLEVSGVFDGKGFLDGEVTYRFYLGLDECSSFDVPGNACLDVKLQLTGKGLHEVSWRVDADVSVREGYAWGSVEEGLHEMDNLYIGERLLYRVEISDEILSYLGGDVSQCSLWLDTVQGALEFSALKGKGNIYTCEITCRSTAKGRLYLCGADGERLATLCRNVGVRSPLMVFSEFSSASDDEAVESLAYIPQCLINGQQEQVYVYLTDTDRINLNSSAAYGFDLGAFDFNMSGVDGYSDLNKAFTASFSSGTECSGGYASLMRLWCFNDGKDDGLAAALAEAYSRSGVLNVVVNDAAGSVTGRCGVGLGIYPVTLTLVDNGWAGHHSSQLSIRVDNDSNMPLEVVVCQMVDNNKAWSSSSLTDEIEQYVKQNLVCDRVSYITGDVCTHDQVIYVSSSEVRCTGSGVFPLDGIAAEDIMKTLICDGLGNDRMYHLVDVTTGGFGLYRADVNLVNALSDGSALYDTIYLSDWDSKGVWLFSNHEPVWSPGNYLMHFPNLSPLNIRRLRQRYAENPKVGLTMWYDNGVFRGYSSYAQGVTYGLKMTVRWHGTVRGYVQTDPKGIWGSPQDHYCTATFDKTLKGVPLAGFSDYVSMDDGTVKDAMDAIYAQTFEDKADGNKFQHSAHPISMDCNVDVSVEGENGEELYPMRVSWEYPYVPYHHAQDAMTYSCQMVQNVPRFTMVHVAKK